MDNDLNMCACVLMLSISGTKVVSFAEMGKKKSRFFQLFSFGRAAQPKHLLP